MKFAQASFKTTLLFGVCASLLACSTPEIQKMSAMDAVKFGNTQFFEMPSYRFDMNAKLLNIQFADKTNDPKTANISKYVNYFGKHLTFGSSAVIDSANQQFQMNQKMPMAASVFQSCTTTNKSCYLPICRHCLAWSPTLTMKANTRNLAQQTCRFLRMRMSNSCN